MKKRHFILCLLSFLFCTKIYSQEYAGKDFWVAFMDMDNFCVPPQPPQSAYKPATYWYDTLELYISSKYYAKVIIHSEEQTLAGSGADTSQYDTVYLTPNKLQYIRVNYGTNSRFMFSDIILNNGIHISSDSNIYVQAVNRKANNKGVTMVIPSASIPNAPEYIVSTNQSDNVLNCFTDYNWNPSSSSEFVIVGIAPISTIEILHRSKSLNTGTQANYPIVITLKQGETYFYVGSTDNNGAIDLSGTIIRSKTLNSKFSVFAGNKLTSSPFKNSSNQICLGQDHVYEQLWPTVNWGKEYTAIPFKNNAGGYYLKCLASEENTTILIDGINYATINAGQYTYFNTNTDSVHTIVSNKPISVLQFSKSSSCNLHPISGSQLGNLSMMQLSPDNQMGTSTMVNKTSILPFTNNPGAPERYINILVKTSDTINFKLNGNSIQSTEWKQSNQAPNFSYTQLSLDTNMYHLTCPNGFISYNYGYAKNEGYSYTSASKFEILQNNFIYNQFCKNDTTTFTALLTNDYTNPIWRIEGIQNTLNGDVVKQVMKDTGWYKITLFYNHIQTNALDSISKMMYVYFADQTPILGNDTLICGDISFVMASRNVQYFNTYLWNGGHNFHAQYIKNAGLYWVKVTERNGCSFIDSVIVTNTPKPIADISVSDTTFCFNKNKELLFQNLSNSPKDSIIGFLWDFGDSTLIDTLADTLFHMFQKHGNYNVRLQAFTNKGCSDDTIVQIKIINSPKAEFIITNKDTCLYTNAFTFTNLTTADTSEHIGFKWEFSTGDSLINNNPIGVQSYNFADKYNAKLFYYHRNGCNDTMSQDYNVYENMVAEFNLLNTITCNGDSVYFINKSTTFNLPYHSIWSFGDLNSSTLKSPAHLYNNKGQYSVKLKVESAVACSDSIIKSVYISAATIADFSVNDSLQCLENNVFTLRDLSTGENNSTMQRIWKFSDGTQIPDLSVYDKIFLLAGKYNIQLNVMNDIGCKDSIIKEVEVINDIPGDIFVNDASQCENNQDFDFTFIKGNTNDSILNYRWYYYKDSNTITQNLENVTFPGYGIQTVRLKILGLSGCSSEKLQSIIVNPKPLARFNFNRNEMCLTYNSFLPLNNSSISKGTIEQYLWNFGDNTSSNLKDPNSKKYLVSGKFTTNLICISDSACRDTATDSIQIHPSPQINITPIATVCLNDSSVFNVQSSISSGSIVFSLWKLGDNNNSNSNSFKHVYSESGLYQVSYITATDKGCLDTFRTTANVLHLPKVDFKYNFSDLGNDRTKVSFFNTSGISDNVYWDFGGFSNSINDTTLEFDDSQTLKVRLQVTDRNGCKGYKDEYIFVGNTLKFFMPNVFSPNGDSHNDGFGPEGIEFTTDYKFIIYNRWGEIMFQTNNPNEKWDGTYKGQICPTGVYIYIVELRDFFYKYDDFKGSFLLMR